jgi:uncharacterized protein DUF6011
MTTVALERLNARARAASRRPCCLNCKFVGRYTWAGDRRYSCRRYPPALNASGADLGAAANGAWPTVHELDWCGEHQAVERLTGAPATPADAPADCMICGRPLTEAGTRPGTSSQRRRQVQHLRPRRRRIDRKVNEIAAALVAGRKLGPARHCVVCRRALDDPSSIDRGIGSECWQTVLGLVEQICAERRSLIDIRPGCCGSGRTPAVEQKCGPGGLVLGRRTSHCDTAGSGYPEYCSSST